VGRGSARRRDIQGLRALAVLLVVAFHAGLPLPGGFTGVDVFFAISGFVITTTLVRELETTGGLRLSGFYARRVRRLLPALAVMLVAVALLGTLASPVASQQIGGLTGLWASLFAANVYLYHLGTGYFDVGASLNPLLHTWTLAVEEQFYLVFPALLLIGWRLGRRALAAVVVAAVSIGSFYLTARYSQAFAIGGVAHPQRFAFYASPTRAWEFGAGSLLALGAPLLRRAPLLLADGLGAAGLAWVGVGALAIEGAAIFSGTDALLPVGGACALLAAGTAPRSLVARGFSVGPAVWVGDLSYSLYLWHWPLIVFARALWPGTPGVAVAAAVFSLLPAWLSYRFVEAPIRRNPRWLGRPGVALAAGCIAVPLVASSALALAPRALDRTAQMQRWHAAELLHADVRRGCNDETPLGLRRADSCSWLAGGGRGEAVLIGDSNAGQFTEPFVRASRRAGLAATVVTLSSCPFVDLRVVGPKVGEQDCRRFVEGSLAEIVRRRPSIAVIAARSDRYVEGSEVTLAGPRGPFTTAPGAKARLWEHGLESILRTLDRAGVPTVVVSPIPSFSLDLGACAVVRVLAGSCGASLARAAVDRRLERSRAAEAAAIAAVPGASAVDFEGFLCGRTTCSTSLDGRPAYRDGTHLSVAGSMLLTDRFAELLSRRARPVAAPGTRPGV